MGRQQRRRAPRSQDRYTDQRPFEGMAAWSPESLLRMDQQFVVAVERIDG